MRVVVANRTACWASLCSARTQKESLNVCQGWDSGQDTGVEDLVDRNCLSRDVLSEVLERHGALTSDRRQT